MCVSESLSKPLSYSSKGHFNNDPVITALSIINMTFLSVRFKDCPVIAVAAKPGGPEAPDTEEPQGVPELIEVKFPTILISFVTDKAFKKNQ